MTTGGDVNQALLEAQEAERLVIECLKENRSFLLEAGAGAGKTFSLIEVLRALITKEGQRLRREGQRIACITYTNAATAVIKSRIDDDPLVFVDTIHAFSWSLVKGFQASLRKHIAGLPAWQERLTGAGGITDQQVTYDVGHRRITDTVISLHHDDVLALLVALMPASKFQAIVAGRYPFVLIDEYQDTSLEVMNSIKMHLLERRGGPVIGLFGDHWQRIYDKTCGRVTHDALTEIVKRANFRSATSIVKVLNNMRPSLQQAVKDQAFIGSATAYHTNTWVGARRSGAGGGHWTGDLPAEDAHEYLQAFIKKLKREGWDFSPDKTKVLMLTHNILAAEQGYTTLARVFRYTDSYIKKEDDHVAYFANKLEPACNAYHRRRYGEMFEILGQTERVLSSHAEKRRLSGVMEVLIALRETGSVGEVLDYVREQGYPQIPESVLKNEDLASDWCGEVGEAPPEHVQRVKNLRKVPYREVVSLVQFIDGHTPFATKHSVKGDQFENVLVVLGRGWNHYNFTQYLEWAANPGHVPADKQDAFVRNRNLFYVCCSRPTTRLALLFTQELSSAAHSTLQSWFGNESVRAFAPECIGSGFESDLGESPEC